MSLYGSSCIPLATVLDALERVAPRLEYYPVWSKVIFASAFVLLVVSIAVYAILYPSVKRRESSGGA